MARKTTTVTVSAQGRDLGKTFLLTELPPRVGHEWATRALFSIANTGIELSDAVLHGGFAGIAQAGIKALTKLPPDIAVPLFNQLFDAVKVIPDPTRSEVVRPMVETDAEEVATLFMLQKEVLTLHIDFFSTASPSTSA